MTATALRALGAIIACLALVQPALAQTGSFNAFDTSVAAGSATGTIQTKVAGAAFSLSVVALNLARTALNTLAARLAAITVDWAGASLSGFTFSAGVAMFPAHGRTCSERAQLIFETDTSD